MALGPWPMLSLSMPEPMLSLSMLILAKSGHAISKSWLSKVLVRSKNIKVGPKWVENQRFGLKMGPNESHGRSGAIQTTPEAQNGAEKSCETPTVARYVIIANLPCAQKFPCTIHCKREMVRRIISSSHCAVVGFCKLIRLQASGFCSFA